MADKINENLLNLVKVLMKEVKSQSFRILELERKCAKTDKLSERIAKVEKSLDDEKDETDKRFDKCIERFDSCDNTIVDHIDSIDDLENKYSKITSQMNDLTQAIKKVDEEIIEIEKRTVMNKDEKRNYISDENGIKQCKFDNFGYCREGLKCKFHHYEETCEIHLQHGFCNRKTCLKRHPRQCFFFERGFCKRNEKCKYLHRIRQEEKECENCEIKSKQIYFCEFCDKNYCCRCTIKEAHLEDVYTSEDVGCKKIHI